MPDPVWFWQRIVSPHMAGLAEALAESGREVVYVAEQPMTAKRAAQGWSPPPTERAEIRLMKGTLDVLHHVASAPPNSIHICQGLRANGLVGEARRQLARRGLRQWVIMETVDDHGFRRPFKRIAYARAVRFWRDRIEGVLAIGERTAGWLVALGMREQRVFSFAYFLPEPERMTAGFATLGYSVLFSGQMIRRKRLELLIDAIDRLPCRDLTLIAAGGGPHEGELRAYAQNKLSGRLSWLGQRSLQDTRSLMATADCLVLPSRHDGWGAVVSEALMAGTPAICSDACGAAGVVRASGVGGVFRSGDVASLAALLEAEVRTGRQTPAKRSHLAQWALCLGAQAGARYLNRILDVAGGTDRPLPPWLCTAMPPSTGYGQSS
jgi:glycosyltransferase involved in cell wall biosynthesis